MLCLLEVQCGIWVAWDGVAFLLKDKLLVICSCLERFEIPVQCTLSTRGPAEGQGTATERPSPAEGGLWGMNMLLLQSAALPSLDFKQNMCPPRTDLSELLPAAMPAA